MEALQKPTQETAEQTGPAEQAGVFLETIRIFPPEFNVIYGAMARINHLEKQHESISLLVKQDFKGKTLVKSEIEVYKLVRDTRI